MPLAAHAKCLTDAGSMLVHRLRRWPNIETALVQHLVFAGTIPVKIIGPVIVK